MSPPILAFLMMAQAPAPAVVETKPVEPEVAKPRVLVLALKPLSVPVDTTEIVDALVADALGRRKDIQVVSQAELRAMVELEQTKQAVGCDTSSCLAELAGAMGARYVVFGQLGTLGSSLVLTLNLYDSTKGQPVGRQIVRAENADMIADQLPLAVEKLGAGIEKPAAANVAADAKPAALGTVSVIASEPQATIAIDGVEVGAAPLERDLAPGPHKITISKPGFSPVVTDVVIEAGQRAAVSADLVRIADSADQDEGRDEGRDEGQGTSWLSTVGWITLGVGSAWTAFQAGWALWAELTLRDGGADVESKETARGSGVYALMGAGAGLVIVGVGTGLLLIPAGE